MKLTKEERQSIKEQKEQAKQERATERKNRKEAKKQAINAKRLEERIAKTAEKYSNDVLKSMNSNKPSFEIKLSKQIKGENRKLYAKAIISSIINKGKENKENFLWIKTSNSSEVPLNDANRKLFDSYVNGEAVELNKFNKNSGEQIEIIVKQLNTYAPLDIIIKPKEHKNKITKGAFFPYYNKTSLNLIRYQIKTSTQDSSDNNILKENCLIYAFRLLGMDDNDVNRCSSYVNNRHIAQAELKELAKELKINIILRSLQKSNNVIHKTQYGNPTGKTYNIALHSNHYFIYDEHTEYSSFYVKNYRKLENERDAQNIIGYKTGTTNFIRRPIAYQKYYISSLHLVDELTKSTDLLIPITNQNINLYDEIYVDHKLKDDFLNIDLNYDMNGTTTKPVLYDKEYDDKKKIKYKDYDFVVVDFETYDNDLKHEPYLLNGATLDFDNKTLINSFSYKYDKNNDLIETYLRSVRKNTVLIFHNAKFDYNFMVPYLSKCSETINDGNFISFKGMFGKYRIVIKCSYKLITAPIRDFPKMFKLPKAQKEVIKHSFYNRENVVKQYHSLEDFIKPFNKSDKETVINNINKWNCIDNDQVDIIEYSKRYCDMDVEILGKGYLIFREWLLDYFDEDINNHLTLPSIVSNIFLKRGIFDGCYELSGLPRDFIAKAMIGGRCMLARNTKHKVKARLNDLDATSLYPSGMKRMKGFMKGQPKPLVPEQTNKTFLDTTDYYFVSVRIKKVNKHLDFPLLRKITDEGKKTFTNDMEGEVVYLGKTALEDAITYQSIEYEIINGYYFNEGFNTSINSIITEIFERRATLKREGNPAELIFKLLMNASYGKLLQKAPDTKTKLMDDKDNEINVYLSRNHATIKSITRIDPPANTKYNFKGKCRIDSITAQSTHHNKVHLGIVILDETKRIMSEVMTTAQDEGIPIYYQDTDSMMLPDADIPRLEEVFMKRFGRKLVGKDLGQFSSDLKPEDDSEFSQSGNKIKDIYATEGIFVGKKAYILKVECVDEEGKIYDAGYHSRCKGVNTQSIEHLLSKPEHASRDKLDIYNDWFEGKAYDLDLTAGQTVCSMDINLKTNTIHNRTEFIRNIRF